MTIGGIGIDEIIKHALVTYLKSSMMRLMAQQRWPSSGSIVHNLDVSIPTLFRETRISMQDAIVGKVQKNKCKYVMLPESRKRIDMVNLYR